MKVETVQPHSNEFGVFDKSAEYEKKKGDIYEVDDDSAQILLDQGLVKKVKSDGGDSKDRGAS